MTKICQLIKDRKPIILYEVIPPQHDMDEFYLEAYVSSIQQLVNSVKFPIAAFNIPEIHQESGRSDTTRQSFQQNHKITPLAFAKLLEERLQTKVQCILNRCSVHEALPAQQFWLNDVVPVTDIDSLILVGGESSKTRYPGPSVTEFAGYLQQYYPERFCLGGITIPSRRHEDSSRDEPNRLITKTRSGIEFFTSQVIYEEKATISLLQAYQELCNKLGQKPAYLFLSFAPVTKKQDVDFLRWLGVKIPLYIEKKLLSSDIGIGWRSIEVLEEVLAAILQFSKQQQLTIPIGLNIEHISKSNFEISKELIDRLGKLYREL